MREKNRRTYPRLRKDGPDGRANRRARAGRARKDRKTRVLLDRTHTSE
ncbi:hypothetical protein [Actinomadura sp. 3N407]